MKKKFIYFLIGALLTGLALVVFQISQASPAIPNPGHGTSQIEGNANLNMNNYKIVNVATSTADTDVATKGYVDTRALSCHVIAVGNVPDGATTKTCFCDTGTLTGGGCRNLQGNATVHVSTAVGGGWQCTATPASAGYSPQALCICCEVI